MKALRTIGILVLVAGLMLGSVGTVFAKGGSPHDPPGKLPKFEGKRQGFAGNVTKFDPSNGNGGNVTIDRGEEPDVIVSLTDEAIYKIPGEMNKWGDLTVFTETLGGNLSVLEDSERRVVTLAGNLTGTETWKALRFMLLPEQGVQGPALHAHRTGNVTEFNEPSESNFGNITIIDIHGELRFFDLAEGTTYRPKELNDLDPENLKDRVLSKFVTVVIMGDPKLATAKAKVIVVHPRVPEGWPIPS